MFESVYNNNLPLAKQTLESLGETAYLTVIEARGCADWDSIAGRVTKGSGYLQAAVRHLQGDHSGVLNDASISWTSKVRYALAVLPPKGLAAYLDKERAACEER